MWFKGCDCISVANVWLSVRELGPDIEYIYIYSVFPEIDV